MADGPWWRDGAAIAAAFALCPVVAALAPADPSAPLSRLDRLIAAERSLGVFREPALWAFFEHRPGLLAVAQFLYLWGHLPATVGALVWARLERPRFFRRARDTFVATQLVVVGVYLLAPTAPPRMLAEPLEPGGWTHSVQSPYAALPSGHVAFAVVVAWILATQVRPLRLVAWIYPCLVAAIVVGTRNHLWVDVVAGVAAAGAGHRITKLARSHRLAAARGHAANGGARRREPLPSEAP
jgi:hypothetical protein